MRCAVVLISLLLAAAALPAQERVTTASGRVVLLYPDGTWKYAPEPGKAGAAGQERTRSREATARLDLARGKASLFYDPRKWQESHEKDDEPGRFRLVHADGDGYAIIIAERLQMSLDGLRQLAVNNARNAAADIQIVSQETRRVNGHDIMALQLQGTIQGIQFVYFGYYYAGPEGTFQLLTYTAGNLFDEYKGEFERLLDGFVVNP